MSLERCKALLKSAKLLEEKEGATRERKLDRLSREGRAYRARTRRDESGTMDELCTCLSRLDSTQLLTGDRVDALLAAFLDGNNQPLIQQLAIPRLGPEHKEEVEKLDKLLKHSEYRDAIQNLWEMRIQAHDIYSTAVDAILANPPEHTESLRWGFTHLVGAQLDRDAAGSRRSKILHDHPQQARDFALCLWYLNQNKVFTPEREAELVKYIEQSKATVFLFAKAYGGGIDKLKNVDAAVFSILPIPGAVEELAKKMLHHPFIKQAEFDGLIKHYKQRRHLRTAFEMGFHARLGVGSQVKKLAGSRVLVREIFNFFEPKKDARGTVSVPEIPDFKKS